MNRASRSSTSRVARIVAALSLLGVGPGIILGQTADRRAIEHFESKIRPVLLDRCVKCHGPEKTKGGLRLDRREGLARGGDSGAVIVAGQPEASLLVEAIRHEGGRKMPPKEKLSDAEVRAFIDWIKAGAVWPETAEAIKAAGGLLTPRSRPAPRVRVLLADVAARRPDDPTLARNLQVWFRADSLDLKDGDPVTRWPDSSGRGRDARPTLGQSGGTGAAPRFVKRGDVNGLPAVRFGLESGLATSATNPIAVSGNGAYTIIVVARLRQRLGGFPFDAIVGFGDPAPPANPGRPLAALISIDRTATGDHQLADAGGWGHDATFGRGTARPLYDRPAVVTIRKSVGPMRDTATAHVNGDTPIGLTQGGTTASPAITHRADFDVIMGHVLPSVGPFLGDLAEVVIYSKALSDDERRSVEAGLIRKYGITAVEPSAPPDTDRERDPLWAFRAVEEVEPPSVKDREWPRSSLDNFILSRLESKGLTPAPPAERRTLIRRAYFDMLGLPPTPEQIDAFVSDPAPDAFDRVVDAILSSPRYGERWGRHWLDVVRYADSGGYETDMFFKNAWRYRDYVVKSLNDDKPYDRFVQEQVAGDELWPDDLALDGNYKIAPEKLAHLEARVGTGLYTLGPEIHESNMDFRKLRNERLSDWVDTTGAVFLGLTIGCARCHDHKFDPITQKDYYAMQAIFAGSREVEEPIVHGMSIADRKQHYPRVVAVVEARKAVKLFDQGVSGRAMTAQEQARRKELVEAIGQAVLATPENDAQGGAFDGLLEVPTASILGHRDPALVPRIHLLNRGDLDRAREEIAADLPAILRQATEFTPALPSPFGSRRALALWLTDPRHPLTARVMVNRIWQGHFGVGLVTTPNDFGKMGQPPSHPELLDWLATQFVRRGWSLKEMHRLILLSRTYQMDSKFIQQENIANDPQNVHLWRMNRRRLEAEALWDSIHSAAGTLRLTMGGPPVVPTLAADELAALREPWHWPISADPGDHTRRGLYILVRRNFPFPMFAAFDAPGNSASMPRRDVTTVAPQALWSLNNLRAFTQARHFAGRIVREGSDRPEGQVDRAWNIALGRPPTPDEKSEALRLLDALDDAPAPVESTPDLARLPPGRAAALTKLCLAIFNLNEFLSID